VRSVAAGTIVFTLVQAYFDLFLVKRLRQRPNSVYAERFANGWKVAGALMLVSAIFAITAMELGSLTILKTGLWIAGLGYAFPWAYRKSKSGSEKSL
jgi:hypothetical protein